MKQSIAARGVLTWLLIAACLLLLVAGQWLSQGLRSAARANLFQLDLVHTVDKTLSSPDQWQDQLVVDFLRRWDCFLPEECSLAKAVFFYQTGHEPHNGIPPDPSNPLVRDRAIIDYLMGMGYLKLGSIDRSLSYLQRVPSLEGQLLGLGYQNEGRVYHLALVDLTESLATLERLGAHYELTMKDISTARAVYERVLRIAPLNSSQYWVARGNLERFDDQRLEAITAYQQAASYAPQDIWIYRRVYGLTMELARYDEARAWAEKWIVAIPGSIEGYSALATVLLRLGQGDQALDIPELAGAALGTDDQDVISLRGYVLYRLGYFADVVLVLEKYLASNPLPIDALTAHVRAAESYERLGQCGHAINHYEQALKLAPMRFELNDALVALRKVCR